MSLIAATLGQLSAPRLRKAVRVGRPHNPVVDGKKRCATCGEVKDVYEAFSWRTRKGGGKAPRSDCSKCEYAKLKEYRLLCRRP